jgi:hypothetical protein
VRQPDQLIEILGIRGGGPPGVAFSYAALQHLRSHTQLCSSIIGFSNIQLHAIIESDPMERVGGQLVTGDYFSALGISTVRGRPLMPEDDQTGNANTVAVISHSLWQGRFGGNADAIGKTVLLENVPFTIVGARQLCGLEVGGRTISDTARANAASDGRLHCSAGYNGSSDRPSQAGRH